MPTAAVRPPSALHPSACSEAGLRQLARLPLRALILSACCQLTDGCLLAIAQGLPQLECLGLFEAGESVTDEGLARLAALAGSLTALDLGYSCWSQNVGLAALLARMPRLRMLNIGGSEGSTDAVVAMVARCCSELRELDVSECQRVSAAAVRQLGQARRGWVSLLACFTETRALLHAGGMHTNE